MLVAAVPVLRGRLLRTRALARVPDELREIYRAPARRDARRAGGVPAAPRRPGRARRAGCSCGPTLPDYIDTTDLLARALRGDVAFVPGRAAYVDGRGGSEMRLNFSGVERRRHPRGRAEDRRRRRRAGRAVRDADRACKPAPKRADPLAGPRVPRGAAGGLVTVAVLKGGTLAGAAPSRCAPAPGSRTRCRARPRGGHDRRRPRPRLPPAGGAVRRGVRRPPRPGREDGTVQELFEILGIPYTARLGCLHPLHRQGARQARAARRQHPDARSSLQPDRVRGARRGARAAGDRGAAGLPDRRQARWPGLGARDQVRAHRGGRAARAVASFSYDTRCCSSASSTAATSRSVLDGPDGPRRCPWSRRSRTADDCTTSTPAT